MPPKSPAPSATGQPGTVQFDWNSQAEVVANPDNFQTWALSILPAAGGDPVQAATEPRDVFTHTFFNVPPGDYIAQGQIVDANGNTPDGVPFLTSAFTVQPQATSPVMVSISATVL